MSHLCARSGRLRAARTVNEEQQHPGLAGGGCDAQHLVKNSAGITFVSTNLGEINTAGSRSLTFSCVGRWFRRTSAALVGDSAGFLFESGARLGLRLGRPRLSGEPGDVGTAGSDGSVPWVVEPLFGRWCVLRVRRLLFEPPSPFCQKRLCFSS